MGPWWIGQSSEGPRYPCLKPQNFPLKAMDGRNLEDELRSVLFHRVAGALSRILFIGK